MNKPQDLTYMITAVLFVKNSREDDGYCKDIEIVITCHQGILNQLKAKAILEVLYPNRRAGDIVIETV